jgi:hypothetical protein
METTEPVWGPYPIGGAMQVGASYRAAEVSNARRRRRQWCPERSAKRQLQARSIYHGGGCHPPVVREAIHTLHELKKRP